MEPIILYITLLLAGFILIGTEIFVPGGIIGLFGSIAWLAAAIIGLSKFPTPWNMLSALAILFVGIATFAIWIRYFPKSRLGKSLSLDENAKAFKSHPIDESLPPGTLGEAVSTLRPCGIAKFDGKRVDVVAEGEWIEAGAPVKIASTANGHLTVVAVKISE